MLRRFALRQRARARLRSDITIWFHPDYSGPWRSEPVPVDHIEPRRGDLVIDQLLADRLIRPEDVRSPELVSLEALARFHSWRHIEASAQPENLARVFGTDPAVIRPDEVLRSVRLAVGGTVGAAASVARGRARIGINLGGGFHHAEPELGSGFCVYNDIGVAVRSLQAEGFDEPILIVDLDVHQGNGNSVAFDEPDRVRIYSIHGSVWSHRRDRIHREIHLQGAVTDDRYQAVLRTTLAPWVERMRPGLIFYIAGADVLAGDRLGSFWVTMDGVFWRDRFVADLARDVGAGLVVTLGGGYSRQAWITHYNFVRYLLTDAEPVQLQTESRREAFDRVSRALDPMELQRDDEDLNLDLDPGELFGELSRHAPARRLLDYYSRHGVELALEQYGFLEKIRERGFEDVRIDLDLADASRQRILADALAGGRWHRVFELVVRRAQLEIPDGSDEPIEALWVEWLLLQNPTASFDLQRPPLPGQKHPGLGLARDFVELLIKVCQRLDLGALVDVPEHYHNGVAASPDFHYLDPEQEGRVRALVATLSGVPVAEASRLVENGRVRTADDEIFGWLPAPHVMPFDDRLRDYFRSEAYRTQAVDAMNRYLQLGLRLQGSDTEPSSSSSTPAHEVS